MNGESLDPRLRRFVPAFLGRPDSDPAISRVSIDLHRRQRCVCPGLPHTGSSRQRSPPGDMSGRPSSHRQEQLAQKADKMEDAVVKPPEGMH